MNDAWETLEAAIHLWVRESTGIAPTHVYWPARGQVRPPPPYCALELSASRTLGPSGTGFEAPTKAAWLLTVTEPEGTNALALYTDSAETPEFEASVTMPADTTPTEARDALLAELDPLPEGLSAEAVDDASIRVAHDTEGVEFWADSAELTVELEQAAVTRFAHTPTAYTLQFDINVAATAGATAAHRRAAQLIGARVDYRELFDRCGWSIGPVVANRPGYLDDATGSRTIVEIELLGIELVARTPKPTLRRTPAFTGATATVTVANAP